MARYLGIDVNDSKEYYFISYNSNDTERVSSYVKLMQESGVPIWYDYGLTIGEKWEIELAGRIRDCKAVIMFMSKKVIQKRDSYVVKEYKLAVKHFKKPTFVVLMDEIESTDVPIEYAIWWMELMEMQCIQTFSYSSMQDCVKNIMLAIGCKPKAKRTRQTKPKPVFQLQTDFSFPQTPPLKEADSPEFEKNNKMPAPQKGKGVPVELLNFLHIKNSGIERISTVIERFYADACGLKVKVDIVQQGPRFTKFYLSFPPSTPVRKILMAQGDFEVLMGVSGIRINAEGNNVYVEFPTPNRSIVPLAEVVESKAFNVVNRDELLIPMGENVDGEMVTYDLCKMPHLLIGGATGSGKSVFLTTFLVGFMMKYTPQEVKFVLIDPKCVEFSIFKGSSFLLFNEIINDGNKALATFNWLVCEMERRYSVFSENGVRNINEYNKLVGEKSKKRMAKIVVVADEFADLVLFDKKSLEMYIQILAQKSRACGIHLVLATQRPSVDVLTGSVKANFPSRIALKVPCYADSLIILDEGGAQNLNRWGDILCKTPQSSMTTERYQSAFVSFEEVKKVVEFTNQYYGVTHDDAILEEINRLVK